MRDSELGDLRLVWSVADKASGGDLVSQAVETGRYEITAGGRAAIVRGLRVRLFATCNDVVTVVHLKAWGDSSFNEPRCGEMMT